MLRISTGERKLARLNHLKMRYLSIMLRQISTNLQFRHIIYYFNEYDTKIVRTVCQNYFAFEKEISKI